MYNTSTLNGAGKEYVCESLSNDSSAPPSHRANKCTAHRGMALFRNQDIIVTLVTHHNGAWKQLCLRRTILPTNTITTIPKQDTCNENSLSGLWTTRWISSCINESSDSHKRYTPCPLCFMYSLFLTPHATELAQWLCYGLQIWEVVVQSLARVWDF